MEIRNKNVFWEALIISILIFAGGILLGYFIELNRTSQIISVYQESELNLLDIRAQSDIFNFEGVNCDLAVKETIAFADRVYEEAKLLEKYESSSKLSEGIIFQHKKYTLLRTILWTNSIQLKKQCANSFTTFVYFYDDKSESIEIQSMQNAFSKGLAEIKVKKGNKMLLIPLASNFNINSINYMKKMYGITSSPAILIDETTKITSLEDLKKIIDEI